MANKHDMQDIIDMLKAERDLAVNGLRLVLASTNFARAKDNAQHALNEIKDSRTLN